MNTFEDYDLNFLGEPVHAGALVQSGFLRGIIVLTETRFVFVRMKKNSEFIELEFPRDAIASATLSRQIGGRQLTIEHDGTRTIFVGDRRQLEPFMEPLMRSTAVNKEKDAAETGTYAGHDTTILGEPVLLAAKASGGWRSGVIVLTKTRLVYLRKKKDETFIDRDTNKSAITDFDSKPMSGKTTLRFNDDGNFVIYTNDGDNLDPFVEELRQSATINQSQREEAQREAEERLHEEVAKRESEKQAKNETEQTSRAEAEANELRAIVGEDILLTAKASLGFGSGVIALTETRLVYLRKKKDETFVDRDTKRSAITDFDPKPMSGNVALRFNDGGSNVSYFHDGDDLNPFVEPLQASADANETKRNEAREARLEGIICSARGRNGQVFLFEDRVLITREGFMSFLSYGFRGDKEILIREITSIGWREPGNFTTGYIHFGYRGGQMPVRTSVFADDSIVNNEDAVLFTDEHQPDFENLRKLLEERRADLSRPQVITASGPSQMDELKKLAELKEMGIVTEEEFEQKKKNSCWGSSIQTSKQRRYGLRVRAYSHHPFSSVRPSTPTEHLPSRIQCRSFVPNRPSSSSTCRAKTRISISSSQCS